MRGASSAVAADLRDKAATAAALAQAEVELSKTVIRAGVGVTAFFERITEAPRVYDAARGDDGVRSGRARHV